MESVIDPPSFSKFLACSTKIEELALKSPLFTRYPLDPSKSFK